MAFNINLPQKHERYNNRASFPATGSAKILYVANDTSKLYTYANGNYTEVNKELASSWGSVSQAPKPTSTSITKSDIGLGNVDNTSDLDKPISTQTQAVLDNKQNLLVSGTNIKTINNTSLLGSGDITISGGGSGLKGYQTIIPLAQYKVTTPAINANSPQAGVQANNRLSLIPYTPQNTYNAGAFYINCTTLQAGAIGRILVYSDSNGSPYQKLYESTDLSLATAGQKLIETTFTFTAGTTYWIAYHNQGTATISVIPAVALPVISIGNSGSTTPVSHYYVSAAIGSAPSTITTKNEWTGNAPLVFIIKY